MTIAARKRTAKRSFASLGLASACLPLLNIVIASVTRKLTECQAKRLTHVGYDGRYFTLLLVDVIIQNDTGSRL